MKPTPARAARIAAGLSLAQAAKRARIAPATLRDCESRQRFAWYRANLLAAAYGCGLDCFLPQPGDRTGAPGRGRAAARPPGRRGGRG